MKQTVNLHIFRGAFQNLRPDSFSYEGLELLFNYLEQYEQNCDVEIEFDVIGLCCDWVESDYDDIIADYSLDNEIDGFADMDECEQHQAVEAWLQDHTMVAGATTDGTLVYCTSF